MATGNEQRRASVVVATYQAPGPLELVLAGLARQSRPPEEIFVADDGSDDSTRRVVERWRDRFPMRFEHHWHEDRGKRKGTIVNACVRASTGGELLFLDGDAIPHRHWVRDHLEAAPRAPVRCGRRVKLGPRLTARVDTTWVEGGRLERPFGALLLSALTKDTRRWSLGLRLPAALARLLHPRARRLMGVNFAVSRAAFEAVNGYDETWCGRREDRELDLRLSAAGFRYVPLLNRAIVYHLDHPEGRPSAEVQAALETRRLQGLVRVPRGLVHEPSGTSAGLGS